MALQVQSKLLKQYKYLKHLDTNWESIVDDHIARLEKEVVNLNRQQIRGGDRADGSDIEPEYRNFTISMKRANNTLTNGNPFIVNLYDTGKFYAGFYVLITKQTVIIDSTDSKTDDLQNKYGEKIFGLNEKNLKLVIEHVKINLLTEIKKELNGLR